MYFLFSRPSGSNVEDNSDNQVAMLSNQCRNIYLLPSVNLGYYAKNGLFENRLIEWSKQFCKPDKLFLDIGAHTGTYAITLAPYCSGVVAFEPQRSTFHALCGGVALSGLSDVIRCLPYGLGSEDQVGTQSLKIVSVDGGGSSLCPAANEHILREELVEIRTLDSIDLRCSVGFIKIDVENNECNVLKGAKRTIIQSNNPPIIFECNNREEHAELFAFLHDELKYRVMPISGVINMFLATVQ